MMLSLNPCFLLIGKTHLLSQGCYSLDEIQHDITNEVFVNNLTPERCIESCRLFGYHYAGVTVGGLHHSYRLKSIVIIVKKQLKIETNK